jgi:hypothetical protein
VRNVVPEQPPAPPSQGHCASAVARNGLRGSGAGGGGRVV